MLRMLRLLSMVALGACGGAASTSSPSSTPVPTATEPPPGPSSVGETTAAPDQPVGAAEASVTSGAATPAPVGDSGGASRSFLARGRLASCTQEAAGVPAARPIAVMADTAFGGCGLRPPSADSLTPGTYELSVLGGPSRLAEATICTAGSTPQVDFGAYTYATFLSVHPSDERWELVFAADAGDRVHIGLRTVRICQGVGPTQVRDALGLVIPGRGRSITVHRCEPEPVRCPPLP